MRTNRQIADAHEKKVAKKVGGKLTPNSGATVMAKGDIVAKDFLIESKTLRSPQASHAIQKDWLIKVDKQALSMRKPYWALEFTFGENNSYYIIDQRTFNKLQELVKDVY